jgi:imidazoleglycerol-phosphate dehydratase / histidinol-phosphatase
MIVCCKLYPARSQPMSRKVLFLDREGVLIATPAGGRSESIEEIALMPGVIPALLRFRDAGYELVVVTNQAGLATDNARRERFDAAQAFLETLFRSQGIEFAAVRICPHLPADACQCRKPGVGLIGDLLADEALDRRHSAVVGSTDSDMQFARNLGLRGFQLADDPADFGGWATVAHGILDEPRTADVARRTRETTIRIDVDLDRPRDPEIRTGIGFFDHMLEQLGKHGGFALRVRCDGDLEVDEHHTVEDVALALGQALRSALGAKRGIQRYGFVLPMDEAAAEVAIDLSGRAYLVFDGKFPREQIGTLPTELVPHFFRSLADTLGATIQIRVRGENTHHMIEACFKGVARALRQAFERRGTDLPSTKGQL